MTSPVNLPTSQPWPVVPVIGSLTFARDVQAFFEQQAGGESGANTVAIGQSCVTNAKSANESATRAEAAAAAANAKIWVSGNYETGAGAISPASIAAGTPTVYIRKTPGGESPVDPANDPTNWVKYVVNNTQGGAVFTSSATIDSGSPFAIKISGTCGTWIKLPDASTLQAGARYSICNAGEEDVRVLDSTGATMGFIRPRDNIAISCADVSTPAGGWIHGLEESGVTQRWQALSTVTGINNIRAALRLDSDRVMFIVGGSSGSQLHAVVWSDAAGGIGATYLVRAAAYYAAAVLCGTGQVMIVSSDNGTAMQGVVLTATGTSITAGSVATSTLSLACTGISKIAATQSGFVMSFYLGTSGGSSGAYIRGLAISGGSLVFGSEVYLGAGTTYARLIIAGSVVRALRETDLGAVAVITYNSSGATLTFLSAATAAGTKNIQNYVVLGNGNIVVTAWNNSTGNIKICFFRLNGSTETVYYYTTAVAYTSIGIAIGVWPVSNNQVVIFYNGINSTTTLREFIAARLTDNLGSVSASTLNVSTSAGTGLNTPIYPSAGVYGSTVAFNGYVFDFSSGISLKEIAINGYGATCTYAVAEDLSETGQLCKNGSGRYYFSQDKYVLKFLFNGKSQIIGKTLPNIPSLPSVRGDDNLSAYAVSAVLGGGISVTRIEVCSN